MWQPDMARWEFRINLIFEPRVRVNSTRYMWHLCCCDLYIAMSEMEQLLQMSLDGTPVLPVKLLSLRNLIRSIGAKGAFHMIVMERITANQVLRCISITLSMFGPEHKKNGVELDMDKITPSVYMFPLTRHSVVL